MTPSDHYAESNRLISATNTRDWNDPSPYVDRRIAAAQVHAQLALVEQQRIANLITLAFQEVRDTRTGEVVEPPECVQQAWAALTDGEYALRPDVARALRIETP